MATFVLVPGAGGEAWYWHRLVPELTRRGHEAIAVDLPAEDDSAGLAEYTDLVVRAIGDREGVVLVAQSMGGFTAPLVCARVPVSLLVLVNAMVPAPGETGGEWWANTGYHEAHPEGMDTERDFLHDLPPDVKPKPSGAASRGSRTRRSSRRGRWRSGRTCRPGSSRAATTGSSRWSSSAAWCASGWAWSWTRSPAGT